jgi:hypothetical protein
MLFTALAACTQIIGLPDVPTPVDASTDVATSSSSSSSGASRYSSSSVGSTTSVRSSSTSTRTTSSSRATSISTSTSPAACISGPQVLAGGTSASKLVTWADPPSGEGPGNWYVYVQGGAAESPGTISIPGGPAVTDGGPPVSGVTGDFQLTPVGGSGGVPPLVLDGGAADSGVSYAACIEGTTPTNSVSPYAGVGEGFFLAGANFADGGQQRAVIDMSCHQGISFYIYNGAATPLDYDIAVYDLEAEPGGGYCGFDASPDNACNSPPLFGGSQSNGTNGGKTAAPGWTQVVLPFTQFQVQPYYGYNKGQNLDTTRVVQFEWRVFQVPILDGGAVPFDFCVAQVSVY